MSSDDYALIELRRAELVFGLVSPLGAPLDDVEKVLREQLDKHGYRVPPTVRLSKLLDDRQFLPAALRPEIRQERLMKIGNRLRDEHGDDILALIAAATIRAQRPVDESGPEAMQGTAHIIRSLKHPAEVNRLRAIYGKGFFLIGVSAPRADRLDNLSKLRDFPPSTAQRLLDKDSAEDESFGQQTRDTFHLADAYVRVRTRHKEQAKDHLRRIVDLVLSHPFLPPTRDEYAMFMAYAASLRSADLSRHVGAVIVDRNGDIIGTGANDAPRAEGGPYWPDPDDFWPDRSEVGGPDHVRGFDSNERERDTIVSNVIRALVPGVSGSPADAVEQYRDKLEQTGLLDLTEFGRAVHAEMSALLACARAGVSPRGATLFCTTFPCHNCTKHLVEAGITRVLYVEPYPKSKALALHNDAVVLPDEADTPVEDHDRRVRYEPFTGIGVRRFLDLFSLGMGSGRPVRRKAKRASGSRAQWKHAEHSAPRLPLDPRSYLEREHAAAQKVDKAEQKAGMVGASASSADESRADDEGPSSDVR